MFFFATPHFLEFIQKLFTLLNSLIPKAPHSLPYPLYLTPPEGILESLFTSSLTKNDPVSSYSPIFSALSTSLLIMQELRPYWDELAI